MLSSDLIPIGDHMLAEVKIHLASSEVDLQQQQCVLELAGIYEALDKKFTMDTAVEIITKATKLYLDSHT